MQLTKSISVVALSILVWISMNWSVAIAQSVKKSDRHVSDREIQSLEAVFQREAKMGGGGGFRRESRKPSEIVQITNFLDEWQKVDSSIAPFLGDWMGFEESLLVYPSINR